MAGRSASVTLRYEAAFRDAHPYIQLEDPHPDLVTGVGD